MEWINALYQLAAFIVLAMLLIVPVVALILLVKWRKKSAAQLDRIEHELAQLKKSEKK
ncbi:hypothetical protein [Alkalicoccus luteus]|uniref:DUF4083 domain-containing protein n=1 Tax=Alkalicoccus luteus TaxID=1237094 RepID=A0A969PNQ5_9BACI|nr:hypothetical protein [Alkalicoccus luteus]NJP37571.1 hypothetical protein [Alkalicoccus luteus]